MNLHPAPNAPQLAPALDGYFSEGDWRNRLACGEFRTLGRALTLIENHIAVTSDLVDGDAVAVREGTVIGITGPPGAGKSTLINALVPVAEDRGFKVAVLAFDPSSRRTGGALLGDRVRMAAHGAFVRSLAARGHLGGTAASAPEAVKLVRRLFDLVIVETVGAGQSEIEIQDIADITAVVSIPGNGDEVQVSKAGILEIADVFVVNQADRPGADETVRQLRAGATTATVPILATVATTGQGVPALLDACLKASRQRSDRRVSSNAARNAIETALAAELLRRASRFITAERWLEAIAAVSNGEQPVAAAINLLANITTS